MTGAPRRRREGLLFPLPFVFFLASSLVAIFRSRSFHWMFANLRIVIDVQRRRGAHHHYPDFG
ncbi:hypothetical protein AALP_AA7G114500 [Arabis alpina]|uniref:Uncharacterized protein n=1 Tax=Arabis alpina TaxID=50452 RepID=A0A087GHE1_ARAAL|nr:hypothetical protein AALP_AA7G114500 [Arabis alpina]